MELDTIFQRTIFISLGFLMTLSILAGCGKTEIPKNQTSEGLCTQNFLTAYNKVMESELVAMDTSGANNNSNIKTQCISFLKEFGKVSESCTAYDLKTGKDVQLNVSEIRATCDTKINGKIYIQ